MNNNFRLKIEESYIEINKMQEDINDMIFHFITNANKLIELSEDDYQIEKTLKRNKISLKEYILNSDCCKQLSNNNISNYSIDELKGYLFQYSKQFDIDYSKYFLALSLYEKIEKIETKFDAKINLEIQSIFKLLPNIMDIKDITSMEYEQLYLKLKNQLENSFHGQKLDETSFSICIQILNDIFNYYINGYPNIPESYLYHSENGT